MKLVTYISLEEFDKLLKAEPKKEYKLAYLLGFGSGLRISEIIGYSRKDGKAIKPLEAEQVNLQSRQIRVIGGKGMKDRITVLPMGFKVEYLKLLPLKIKRITLQAHYKALCKKAIGRDSHFHELRHGFGNMMANVLKIPLPQVMALLGHSRLDTTGIYTISNPVEAVNAVYKAWGEI